MDCDNDSLLIYVIPEGPVCHTGTFSCFGIERTNIAFLNQLNKLIKERKKELPENSYTTKLFREGADRIVQKVGEEAVELVIEAKDDNIDLFKNEAADLLYHLLILLKAKGVNLESIEGILKERHKK